jgi:hypothetical protein
MAREKTNIDLITPGWDVRQLNQFDYMEIVYQTPLQTMGKLLLSYYAFRYNFKKGRGAYAGIKRTARDIGVSTSTVNKWKKYLLKQQWIEVKKRGDKETDVIYVSVGLPDQAVTIPNYLKSEWEDWNEFLKDNRSFPNVAIVNGDTQQSRFGEVIQNQSDLETNAALKSVSIAM